MFILLVVCCMASTVWAQNKIVLNTHDQAPLSYPDEKGELTGTAVLPVLYALNRMGWQHEFSVLPWIRAQQLVQQGRADGFFAASSNAERDTYAVRSAPIAYQVSNWYLLKENPLNPDSPEFKARARVGSYQGANMLKWLKDNAYNVTGEPPEPDKLFLMLISARFDACLANDYNYANFIRRNPVFQGSFRSVMHQSTALHVYFSKSFLEKHPGFLAEFNRHVTEYALRNKAVGTVFPHISLVAWQGQCG